MSGAKRADPWFRNRGIRDGIHRALHARMRADPSVFCMGEGSHMKMRFDAPAILEEFPDRILTLPISEDGSNGFAVGLALAGIKPVVDVISSDFLYRCMDSICNTIAKHNHVRPGRPPATFVIRAEFMTGGPSTGQRVESMFMHIPGLRVVIPSNPKDACGLMLTALTEPGATVFFEDRMIEDSSTDPADAPDDVPIPFGSAKVRKPGKKVTIVSYGLTTRLLDEILRDTPYEHIDLRTLWPLDIDLLVSHVEETSKLLVVEADTGGIGAEVVTQVVEKINQSRGYNFAPDVARLTAPRVTIPACRELHDRLLPSREQILEAARRLAR